jgi:hypothetical protein
MPCPKYTPKEQDWETDAVLLPGSDRGGVKDVENDWPAGSGCIVVGIVENHYLNRRIEHDWF